VGPDVNVWSATEAAAVLVSRPEDFGVIVRERRLGLRLTQLDLASRAGVSRPTLARIEAGHPRPELDVVLKLATALGFVLDVAEAPPVPVDLDALIERTTNR
jgi:transcriptional regulator with XRE-family HTH domain